MNLEQMKARLAEIAAKLEEFEGVENFEDSAIEEIENLTKEFASLKKNIETKEAIAAAKSAVNASAGRKTTPEAATRVEVLDKKQDPKGGFKSFGDFAMAVKQVCTGGSRDPRFNNAAFEKNGEDGGYLVPEDFVSEIKKKLGGDDSLLAKTTQTPVSGNGLSLVTDENQPWNGGAQAYWTAEGAPISESKDSFGEASWKLHKLASLVKVTDELLDDATALEAHLKRSAPESIMHKINSAILSGNGVGKPRGILNSGFRVTVSKESGQSADTIVARNVIKMYSHLLPTSLGRAAWYVNAGCVEQLRTMKDDQGQFIYVGPGSQLNQSPYALLMGLPVIPMIGSMKALGDEGDIILADLSYYYTIVKAGAGIKSDVSQHLYFDQAKTAFRFTMRIDGSCPFKTPVTTEFGSYQLSGFVTLQDR